MVKRIHFTDEDLRNVRVGPTYGPLAETVLSLERLMRTDWSRAPVAHAETIGFGGWRERDSPALEGLQVALVPTVPALAAAGEVWWAIGVITALVALGPEEASRVMAGWRRVLAQWRRDRGRR